MKIVIIGGHLSPALSVITSLPKDTEVLFIGRKYGLEGDRALSLEYTKIKALNIPFVELNTGRLPRKLTKYTFSSLFKLPLALIKSFFILTKFGPDIVVGFGGYVSVPVGLLAFILRIPIVIHEQTLEAGFANRFLAKFATKICISWDLSRKYFPKEKTVLTGNPVRKFSISNFQFQIKNNLPTIYITGGSSGSHFINSLVEGCIKKLLENYIVFHQTGDAQEFHDFDRLKKLKNSLPTKLSERYVLKKFVEPSEVGEMLKKASLVISRSGMNTVTELIYFEKPALLIPLPFSQNNEQLKNAKFLEKIGLGIVLQQEDLDYQKLFKEISLMFQNVNNFKINKEYEKEINKDASDNIISVINYVYKASQ